MLQFVRVEREPGNRGYVYTRVTVVCLYMYKSNKTSTRTSITDRALPWKHKAINLVHEEPR